MLSYTRFDPKRNPFPHKSPAAGNPRGRAPNLALLGEILRRALLHRHAGVVVLENLHIALPLLGHGVGAVLAHPHAVAKAGDGKVKVSPDRDTSKDAERRRRSAGPGPRRRSPRRW